MTDPTEAQRDGKCACCLTPYTAGTALVFEFGKFVLAEHADSARTDRR